MSEARHTPGPWEWETTDGMAVSFEDEFGEWSSDIDDSEREVSASTATRPIRGGGKVIALVVYAEYGYTPGRIPELNDNARLIAAAPDLLTALDWLVSITEDAPPDTLRGRKLADARAAIAKAKGATP